VPLEPPGKVDGDTIRIMISELIKHTLKLIHRSKDPEFRDFVWAICLGDRWPISGAGEIGPDQSKCNGDDLMRRCCFWPDSGNLERSNLHSEVLAAR
jgi:hypothetical protein